MRRNVDNWLSLRESLGVVRAASGLITAAKIQRLSSDQVLRDNSDQIHNCLSNNWTDDKSPWVVMCAYNEEKEIPKTLLALSYSSVPLRVLVVNNNSRDGTSEVAAGLGAKVLDEVSQGKIFAMKRAFGYLEEVKYTGPILHTDADTIPVRTWAKSHVGRLNAYQENGAILSGLVISHGEICRDVIRTVCAAASDIVDIFRGKVPNIRGNNMAMTSDRDGFLRSALANTLDTNCVSHVDVYLRDRVKDWGGVVDYNFSPEAIVFSLGDRYPNVTSIIKTFLSSKHRMELYRDWHSNHSAGDSGYRYK